MNEPKSKQVPPGTESSDTGAELQASTVNFDVVALSMTIYYNREGDHDHNGMVFALEANARPVRPSAPDGPGGGEPPEQRGHNLFDLHGQPPEGSMEWAMDPTARREVRHPRAALRAAVDQDS